MYTVAGPTYEEDPADPRTAAWVYTVLGSDGDVIFATQNVDTALDMVNSLNDHRMSA